MEKKAIPIRLKDDNKIAIYIIPGHFMSSHAHVNYYIDMTHIKCVQNEAERVAKTMLRKFDTSQDIDTILCMDGCGVIGGFMAKEMPEKDIYVVTPNFHANGQFVFKDDLKPMIEGKNILLLIASTTTGVTVEHAIQCVGYYGGKVDHVFAVFSGVEHMESVRIQSLFTKDDILNYHAFAPDDCPDCRLGKNIDAFVSGVGYSQMR